MNRRRNLARESREKKKENATGELLTAAATVGIGGIDGIPYAKVPQMTKRE